MSAPAASVDLAVAIARIETRLDAMDKAEALRAEETARRLMDLNHSHERDEAKQITYLPREVFDKTVQETTVWRESVTKALGTLLPRELFEKTLEEWQRWRVEVDRSRAELAGRRTVIAAIVVAGLSFIGVVINTVARLHGG